MLQYTEMYGTINVKCPTHTYLTVRYFLRVSQSSQN